MLSWTWLTTYNIVGYLRQYIYYILVKISHILVEKWWRISLSRRHENSTFCMTVLRLAFTTTDEPHHEIRKKCLTQVVIMFNYIYTIRNILFPTLHADFVFFSSSRDLYTQNTQQTFTKWLFYSSNDIWNCQVKWHWSNSLSNCHNNTHDNFSISYTQ